MAVGVPWDLGFPLPGVHYEKRLPYASSPERQVTCPHTEGRGDTPLGGVRSPQSLTTQAGQSKDLALSLRKCRFEERKMVARVLGLFSIFTAPDENEGSRVWKGRMSGDLFPSPSTGVGFPRSPGREQPPTPICVLTDMKGPHQLTCCVTLSE